MSHILVAMATTVTELCVLCEVCTVVPWLP